MFSTLKGKNKGPDLFSGPIGKQLHGAHLPGDQLFEKIPNSNFPVFTEDVI